MSNMNRRQFSSMITISGLGLAALKLTGCRPTSNSNIRNSEQPSSDANQLYSITIYDLLMEGHSNLGSGYLGPNGTLKATTIAAGVAVTLNYIQDPHGHKFDLTPADFERLKKGEKIEIHTTMAQGHNHRVIIDPSKKVPNGNTVVIPDPTKPQAETEKIWATIEEKDEPHLYVQGSKLLDPSSVEYCLDTKDVCNSDQTLWKKSKIHLDTTDRQVLMSEQSLLLDMSKQEIPLMIRGKLKENSRLIEIVLKLARKS
jgi:hypothetical protein